MKFHPPPQTRWNVISLGAGVQSSTMALMASKGLITPMPDFAVFADTQDEPDSVYRWLDYLEPLLAFPVYRVSRGKLSERVMDMRVTKDGRVYSKTSIPLHVLTESGERTMITHRSCTKDFKITPILQELRKRCEVKRGQKETTVTSWIGISYDEMQRMKNSRDAWVQNRWPLVEMRMTRQACFQWMRQNDYPEPPKSACVFCPFKDAAEFRRMQVEEPQEFQKAVEFEQKLNNRRQESGNYAGKVFVYRNCKPLDQIDFRNDVERGQGLLSFMDECDGMCGV